MASKDFKLSSAKDYFTSQLSFISLTPDKELKTSINYRNYSVRTCEQPFPVWGVICVIYQPVRGTAQQKRPGEEWIYWVNCIQFPLSSGLETASRTLPAMIILSIILIPEPFLFIYLVLNSNCNGFPIVMTCWVKSGSLFFALKPSARSPILLP